MHLMHRDICHAGVSTCRRLERTIHQADPGTQADFEFTERRYVDDVCITTDDKTAVRSRSNLQPSAAFELAGATLGTLDRGIPGADWHPGFSRTGSSAGAPYRRFFRRTSPRRCRSTWHLILLIQKRGLSDTPYFMAGHTRRRTALQTQELDGPYGVGLPVAMHSSASILLLYRKYFRGSAYRSQIEQTLSNVLGDSSRPARGYNHCLE